MQYLFIFSKHQNKPICGFLWQKIVKTKFSDLIPSTVPENEEMLYFSGLL